MNLSLQVEQQPVHVRYCVHCTRQLPENRLRRGKYFCSTECHAADRKERRAMQALFHCRLCGRPKRAKKEKLEPVRSAHNQPSAEVM